MPTQQQTAATHKALEALRQYMYHFYPERLAQDPFPLAFWQLDDLFTMIS